MKFKCIFLHFGLLIILCLPSTFHCDFVPADDCSNRNIERREHSIEDIPSLIGLTMSNKHVPGDDRAVGIIIDRNMVLTLAYHCEVSPAAVMRVYPGEGYIMLKRNEIGVEKYELHPYRVKEMGKTTYDESNSVTGYVRNRTMDFCLLKLRQDMKWGQAVQMASLPNEDDQWPGDRNSLFMTSGWGHFEKSSGMIAMCGRVGYNHLVPDKVGLFYTLSKKLSEDECRQQMQDCTVPHTNFCMGRPCEAHHTTYGDDGGPVMDPLTMKVVAMVVNCRNYDPKGTQQMTEMRHAVKWINEMREVWAPEVPDSVPSNSTYEPDHSTSSEVSTSTKKAF